jgi:hypothetical protein
VTDQAELHGVLAKMRPGLTLIPVSPTEAPPRVTLGLDETAFVGDGTDAVGVVHQRM